MTVSELILKLKKMPKDARVFWQDFDSDPYGISSAPNTVFLLSFDNLTEQEQSQNDFCIEGEVVIIKG